MARYKLHCNGGSGNSYKVALYLNCAGLDWEPIGVDFAPAARLGVHTGEPLPMVWAKFRCSR
jgi:hypothetical protein